MDWCGCEVITYLLLTSFLMVFEMFNLNRAENSRAGSPAQVLVQHLAKCS